MLLSGYSNKRPLGVTVKSMQRLSHLNRTVKFLIGSLCFIVGTAGGAEFPPAPAGTFSIVVIPDTQHYRGKDTKAEPTSSQPLTNRVFTSYVDWTAGNLKNQRVAFVSHVGDIVDINNRQQWTLARSIMDKLHGKVPYGISVGNHDMTAEGDSSLFQEFFPPERFEQFEWYAGYYKKTSGKLKESGNNANSCQLFSAAGLDFVFLHLECNAPDKVLDWADDMLKKYSQRRAIITTHMGLGPRKKPKSNDDFYTAPKGRMDWKKCHGKKGNTPEEMWEKSFRKHANLFMICSGDQSRTQALRQTVRGKNGNVVYELLSDYGSGGMRVMRFVPKKNLIEVRTWNPIIRQFPTRTRIVPAADQHQFTLEYQMSAASSR